MRNKTKTAVPARPVFCKCLDMSLYHNHPSECFRTSCSPADLLKFNTRLTSPHKCMSCMHRNGNKRTSTVNVSYVCGCVRLSVHVLIVLFLRRVNSVGVVRGWWRHRLGSERRTKGEFHLLLAVYENFQIDAAHCREVVTYEVCVKGWGFCETSNGGAECSGGDDGGRYDTECVIWKMNKNGQ